MLNLFQIYLQEGSGFSKANHRKLTKLSMANQIQPSSLKPSMTPLELGLESQKIFRSIGIFCHGFLAGLAFWQLIMVRFYKRMPISETYVNSKKNLLTKIMFSVRSFLHNAKWIQHTKTKLQLALIKGSSINEFMVLGLRSGMSNSKCCSCRALSFKSQKYICWPQLRNL